MLVKQVMSSPAICLDYKKTFKDAIDTMEEKNIGFLPITKNDILVGVLTDRDLLIRGKSRKSNIQINNLMTDKVYTIGLNSSLEEAAKVMSNYKVRRLVVTEDNLIKGVITSKDLLYQSDLLPYIKQTYLNRAY